MEPDLAGGTARNHDEPVPFAQVERAVAEAKGIT